MKQEFELDSRLAADTIFIADGPLSQLRLMDDARFPWLVLVPRIADAVEWVDLDANGQTLLWDEVRRASQLLRAFGACDKLNVGSLGNVVRQLHVHVVARRTDDAAWPGPVWGSGPMQRLASGAREARIALCRALWHA